MADEGGEAVQEVELVIDTSQPQVITVDADVAPADQPTEPPASPSVHEQPAPEVAAEPTPEAAPPAEPAEAAEAAPPAEGTPPAEPVQTAEAAQTTEASPEAAPPAEPVPGSEEPAHEATGGEPEPSGDVAPVIIPSKISAAKHTSEVAMSRSKQSQESGKNLQTVSFEKIQSDTKVHSTTTADLAKKSSTVQYDRLSRKVTSKELRDMSKSKMRFSSAWSIKRGSIGSYVERQKAPKFMNTYKLDSEKPFNVDKVHSIIVEVLNELIEDDMTYDPQLCATKAKWASETIRTKVKAQEYDRYKLICLVTMGEKRSYDIFACARFLWDCERDRYASYFHENMYLYITASVYGLYYE